MATYGFPSTGEKRADTLARTAWLRPVQIAAAVVGAGGMLFLVAWHSPATIAAPVEASRQPNSYDVSTEDGKVVEAQVVVKSSVRLPPGDPSRMASRETEFERFTVTVPGVVAIPRHPYPDGSVFLYFSAPGFAQQWTSFEVKDGAFTRVAGAVKLWRSRYAVVRYAFNKQHSRALTPDASETGRVAVTHWSHVPNFRTWQVWQTSSPARDAVPPRGAGHLFGDRLTFQFHNYKKGCGFTAPPKGASFDDMTEAPESGYRNQHAPLKSGLALYFRDEGGYPTRRASYGKVLVESLSDTPPEGVRLIEPPAR